MTDVCRVDDTEALESTAKAIDKEKVKLDGTRFGISGTKLPAAAFGRTPGSAQAATGLANALKQVDDQIVAGQGEMGKLVEFLRGNKERYETLTAQATQCLINIRKNRPATPQ